MSDKGERLERLLDVALAALRADDFDGSEMALDAALKEAKSLPQKPPVICLPDRSTK